MSDVSVAEVAAGKRIDKALKKAVKGAAAKKKVVAKKKAAPKVKAKKGADGTRGDASAVAARKVHHQVEANGKVYGSVFKAFEALKLPMGSHQGLRAKLKQSGKETFETDTGRKVNFKLVKS